jgi:hypothetical protein
VPWGRHAIEAALTIFPLQQCAVERSAYNRIRRRRMIEDKTILEHQQSHIRSVRNFE